MRLVEIAKLRIKDKHLTVLVLSERLKARHPSDLFLNSGKKSLKVFMIFRATSLRAQHLERL